MMQLALLLAAPLLAALTASASSASAQSPDAVAGPPPSPPLHPFLLSPSGVRGDPDETGPQQVTPDELVRQVGLVVPMLLRQAEKFRYFNGREEEQEEGLVNINES